MKPTQIESLREFSAARILNLLSRWMRFGQARESERAPSWGSIDGLPFRDSAGCNSALRVGDRSIVASSTYLVSIGVLAFAGWLALASPRAYGLEARTNRTSTSTKRVVVNSDAALESEK